MKTSWKLLCDTQLVSPLLINTSQALFVCFSIIGTLYYEHETYYHLFANLSVLTGTYTNRLVMSSLNRSLEYSLYLNLSEIVLLLLLLLFCFRTCVFVLFFVLYLCFCADFIIGTCAGKPAR